MNRNLTAESNTQLLGWFKATKTTCSVTTCPTSDTHDKSALTSATKGNQGTNRKTDVTEITCKRLKRAWVTESLMRHDSQSFFAFSVIFLFTHCEAKSENYSEVRKLLPVGEGFGSETGVWRFNFNWSQCNLGVNPVPLQKNRRVRLTRWEMPNTDVHLSDIFLGEGAM